MVDDAISAREGEGPSARRLRLEGIEAALQARLAVCEEEAERRQLTLGLVLLYYRTGRPQAAVAHLQWLLAATEDREEQASHLLALGQLMEQLADPPAAIGFYTRGLALQAGDAEVRYLLRNNLGYCLSQLGRHAEAEPLCRAAIALDAERYNAHKNLGVALEGQGRHAEAAESYLRAVRANPMDPRALRHLEGLLAEHPELAGELPDLPAALDACRALVGPARWVQ